MFGRHLRTRLDLLRSDCVEDGPSLRVTEIQQNVNSSHQKQNCYFK